MTVQNLYRRGAPIGWMPDSDEFNAPDGALLLATNLVSDEEGVLTLRKGTSLLYSGFTQQNVHSLWTTELFNDGDPLIYRYAAADDRVFRNGVDLGAVFDGTGDVAFDDDSYQVFMARGLMKKKDNGQQFHNWGIPAPTLKAELVAVTNLFQDLATFDSTESPAIVVHEGTNNGFISGWDGTAIGALSVKTDPTTGRASLSKTYAAPVDLFDIKGAEGSDTDLFDMFVWVQEPREFSSLKLMFGLATSGTDPFSEDRYEFDFDPNQRVDIKDASSSVSAIGLAALDQSISQISPEEFTSAATPEQVQVILQRLGRFAGPRVVPRTDAAQSSPAWFRLSVTRGQFNRIGGTPGRDWHTVKAFKIVFEGLPGSTLPVIAFDSAIFIGGGDASLTGRYRIGYRYVRNTGVYTEKSSLSPLSEYITLNQQGLQITIPSGAILGADSQVNGLWIYIVGGFIPSLYRCAVTGLDTNPGAMTIDEFAKIPDGTVSVADMARIGSPGFTLSTNSISTLKTDIVFTLNKSDIQILTEDERLEPFAAPPPDHIVAIAGPFGNRMFCLTEDGWLWPSSQTSPSNFSVSHVIDLRRYGRPLWAVRTNGGIHCGFTKDILRIEGRGDETADHLTTDMFAEPLHVGNPPVDAMVYTDGNIVVYRSADGLMTLSGQTIAPIPQGATSLLWTGFDRYGVGALNTATGRFRIMIDNHILYMIAPEVLNEVGAIQAAETKNVTLDPSANGEDDFYVGLTIRLTSGPVAGQVRRITSYSGTSKIAGIDEGWNTNKEIPPVSTNYEILNVGVSSVWRFSFNKPAWSRTIYPYGLLSIFREPGGPLVAGTDTGQVVLLEDGNQDIVEVDGQQVGVDIPVDILYPVQGGADPLARNAPFDLTFEGSTGGGVGSFSILLDGVPTSYSFSTPGLNRYRIDVSSLVKFYRAQLRLTGSFSTFKLQSVNLTYRELPQHMMALDVDVLPQEPSDMTWPVEVEVDCDSPAPVELLVFLDDVQYGDPLSVPNDGKQLFVPNVRSVFRVVLRKGTKARRPRLRLRTTNANGRGEIGFECYGIRVRERSSGNRSEKGFRTIYPVGQK